MIKPQVKEVVAYVTETVIPLVDAFRELQDTSGRLIDDLAAGERLLTRLRLPVRTVYSMIDAPVACADAFDADVDAWLERGLDSVPQFDRSLAKRRNIGAHQRTIQRKTLAASPLHAKRNFHMPAAHFFL